MRKPLSLLLLLLVAAGCNTGSKATGDSAAVASGDSMKAAMPADDNAARDAIAKIRTGWKDAANKHDAAAVAALYADDATMVGTGIPVANGKAEIQTRLGQILPGSTTSAIDSKDLVISGDVAYDYGTYSQTVTPPKGKAMPINGYYVVTLKKGSDGSWKMLRHLSVNSGNP